MFGLGLGLGVGRRASGALPRWKFVSMNSCLNTGNSNNPGTVYGVRIAHYIRARASKLRLVLPGWYATATQTNNLNALPLTAASIELAGVTYPVTFGGSRSVTVGIGVDGVVSDDVNLPVVSGNVVYIKMRFDLALDADSMPFADIQFPGDIAGQQEGHWSDSAATTLGSVDSPGLFTFTGTSPNYRAAQYKCGLIGLTTAPKVYVTVGSSSPAGSGDSIAPAGTQKGYGHRALAAASLPHGNMCVGSIETLLYRNGNTGIESWFRYATHALMDVASNDIALGANAATAYSRTQSVIARLVANGVSSRVVAPQLRPRNTSSDSWTTVAGQTATSAEVAAYNALLAADSSLVYVPSPLIRDSVALDKWVVTGAANYATSDGIHPATAGHAIIRDSLAGYL